MALRRRETMSAVDTAWLRMDRPDNLMMICALVTLEEPIDFERFLSLIRRRFLRYARFRKRAVEAEHGAYWEPDPDFDLERHVLRSRLPGKGTAAQLQSLLSKLVSRPLDPAHPRWQFQVVDNHLGGSAVIMRMHHCYADGIALTQVLLAMTHDARRKSLAAPAAQRTARAGDAAAGIAGVGGSLPNMMKLALKIGETMIERGIALWQNPQAAFDLARQGSAIATEIAKLALMPQDSMTRFKGRPGLTKRVAWAEPLDLVEVKAVGKLLGASVNDVLLACVAGALRGYLADNGDPVRDVSFRALVPVNLRPPDQALTLGNEFGLVFVDLPIGIESSVRRVEAVRATMDELKSSYQPVLALGLLAAMGAGPKILQDQLLLQLSRNATAVMTNVPGPQEPLYIAGSRIDKLLVWVPQSGNIGMGVSVLSYNGKVQFGLLTDRRLCPDPERISGRFGSEFERLKAAAKRRFRGRKRAEAE